MTQLYFSAENESNDRKRRAHLARPRPYAQGDSPGPPARVGVVRVINACIIVRRKTLLTGRNKSTDDNSTTYKRTIFIVMLFHYSIVSCDAQGVELIIDTNTYS